MAAAVLESFSSASAVTPPATIRIARAIPSSVVRAERHRNTGPRRPPPGACVAALRQDHLRLDRLREEAAGPVGDAGLPDLGAPAAVQRGALGADEAVTAGREEVRLGLERRR